MASRNKIIQTISNLLPLYPAFSPSEEQIVNLVNWWDRILQEISDARLERAIEDLVKRERYFPGPAIVFEACRREADKSGDDPDVAARLERQAEHFRGQTKRMIALNAEYNRLKSLARDGEFNALDWQALIDDSLEQDFYEHALHFRTQADHFAEMCGMVAGLPEIDPSKIARWQPVEVDADAV